MPHSARITRQVRRSFIQNPYPVPLKQVLAGRLRPVPTAGQLNRIFIVLMISQRPSKVTELLAAYKVAQRDLFCLT